MKKLIYLLVFISVLNASCKKEPEPQLLKFLPTIASPDEIKWDSIAHTTISYSYQKELTSDQINNPDVYTYSLNVDLKTEYLTLEPNQVIVIKEFNIIGKSGKIMYYIPFTGESAALNASLKLPYIFQSGEGKSNLSIPVIRYTK